MQFKIEDISYTVTEFCPGPCRYCSMWELPNRQKEELSGDELDSVFGSKYLDLKKVHITGGEPHLSSTYLKAVDSIYKYHTDVIIDTPITGWFPEKHVEIAEYVLKKAPIYRLDISLDGDEETHSKIRLHKDGFKKSIETVEMLKKIKGVALRFQFTIFKQNLHMIEWAYNFAKEMGVGLYIGYGRYNPDRYRNKKDNVTQEEFKKDDFFFTLEERELIDRQLRNIGYDKGRYAYKYEWQKMLFDGAEIDFDCYMGQRSIDIDSYGNVFPCLLWLPYLKIGNIRDFGGLDNILETENAKSVLQKIANKECQKDCLFTCATKMQMNKPKLPSVGLANYSGGKFGYIFSETDVIPLRPWWYDEYKERGLA